MNSWDKITLVPLCCKTCMYHTLLAMLENGNFKPGASRCLCSGVMNIGRCTIDQLLQASLFFISFYTRETITTNINPNPGVFSPTLFSPSLSSFPSPPSPCHYPIFFPFFSDFANSVYSNCETFPNLLIGFQWEEEPQKKPERRRKPK